LRYRRACLAAYLSIAPRRRLVTVAHGARSSDRRNDIARKRCLAALALKGSGA